MPGPEKPLEVWESSVAPAAVSGVLLLRQPFASRGFCLGILLLSLLGTWHEKEARDTWTQRQLQRQIDSLQLQLGKIKTE